MCGVRWVLEISGGVTWKVNLIFFNKYMVLISWGYLDVSIHGDDEENRVRIKLKAMLQRIYFVLYAVQRH